MPVWKPENQIQAGKIIKQHGYLGNTRVAFSFSINQEKLKKGSYLYIEWNEKPVPYLIETIQWQDESNAIVKLADINTEEAVLKLLRRNIYLPEDFIEESEDEEEGEFEWMIGFSIIDAEKTILGKVTDYIEADPQIIIEAQTPEGKEFLVPYHPDLVKKIDKRKKTIHVDLPEGLLDL